MHEALRLWNDNEKLIKALHIATTEHKKLLAVIMEVHGQHADDLCWMPADVNKIFQAAGLPKQDLRVGNKADMLKNCDRYVNCLESGGPWKSYAELEKERDGWKDKYYDVMAKQIVQ